MPVIKRSPGTARGQVHVCANPNCGAMDSIGGTCSCGSSMRPVTARDD